MAGAASIGKLVRGSLYVHTAAVDLLDPDRQRAVESAVRIARDAAYNVVRIDWSTVALLHYHAFEVALFPRLQSSTLVHPESGRMVRRNYHGSSNPLILHRKELLVRPEHPRRSEWADLTARLVARGLFDHPAAIGRERQWANLLAKAGLTLPGPPP